MTTVGTLPPIAAQEVRVETSRPRVTAPSASRQFRDAIGIAPATLLSGVDAASTVLPGGGIVSAAVREGAGAASTTSTATSGLEGVLGTSSDENMRLLLLQEQISAENRRYTALSNVLKARHETAKAAVNNIR